MAEQRGEELFITVKLEQEFQRQFIQEIAKSIKAKLKKENFTTYTCSADLSLGTQKRKHSVKIQMETDGCNVEIFIGKNYLLKVNRL